MNESTLTELLERAGERTAVGPPPLAAMRTGVARRRRRRTVAWSVVSAAAVVAVIAGTALFTHGPRTGDAEPPVASTATPYPFVVRLVVLGRAQIVVPKFWGTNEARCGTPLKDTVLFNDPSAGQLCQVTRPVGVESVAVASGKRGIDFHADQTIQITGVEAQRQRTSCFAQPDNVPVCTGAVFIPSLNVSFVAQSSSSADEVDRILSRIRITP
jgi:hypothetical protein